MQRPARRPEATVRGAASATTKVIVKRVLFRFYCKNRMSFYFNFAAERVSCIGYSWPAFLVPT